VGQIIAGRFRVLSEIGHGGMGRVFRAEQVRMKRVCALKVIMESGRLDSDTVSRFAREATNASKIGHPNVATVYEFGESDDGVLYIAMEYVDGETLAELMKREGALPPRRAVSIAWQIADALAAAHELGIVHRDLKPENIMLGARKKGGDLVKVVDFGLARVMGAESQVVTRTGYILGTPRYMSPEQLTDADVDERSDIYSLGLMLFGMLTGRSPWDIGETPEPPPARLTSPARSLAQQRPDVNWPAPLQAALDRALALLPRDRYAQVTDFAGDVADAVLDWIPDNPQSAEPWNARLRYETPRGTPRTPAAAYTPVHPAEAPTETPRPRRRRALAFALSLSVLAVAVLIAVVARMGSGFGSVPAPRHNDSLQSDSPKSGQPVNAARSESTKPRAATDVLARGTVPVRPAPADRQVTATRPAPSDHNVAPAGTGLGASTTVDARQALERLRRLTDAHAPNVDSARAALEIGPPLLQQLQLTSDRVEAQYYMAEAHLILDEAPEACVLLRRIESASRSTRFRLAVANYLASPELQCR
jgi:serine/threonine-protein kinase